MIDGVRRQVQAGYFAACFAAAVCVVGAALVGCGGEKAHEVPANSAPPAPQLLEGVLHYPAGHPQLALLSTTAAAAANRITVEMPARLVWNEERTQRVVPAFAGRVTRIEADLGSAVKPGSVLARLASPEFGAAQADAAKARADAELSHKALARQRELFEAGIVARKELEQAQADVQRSAAELARAQARTSLYGAGAVQGVDQQLALRASVAGIVVERNLTPGQELRPDQLAPGAPLPFVISDPTSLWVLIDARESEVATLRPGVVFKLSVPALGERIFEGQLTAVADAIDPNSRTVKVRGKVDNKERLLRAEMLATASIERSQGAGVAVPASAVTLRGTGHWVYVQRSPGVFEPREVKLGNLGPQQALVSGGLEVGDVVVSGNALLLARQHAQLQTAPRSDQGGAEKSTARATASAQR